jgi:predicted transcriptional regulator
MGQSTQAQGSKVVNSDTDFDKGHDVLRRELRIGDVMSRNIVAVAPHDTLWCAASRMAEYGVSCVLVTDGGQVTGILTEKDVLKGVAQRESDFRRTTVSERMSAPVATVSPDCSLIEAGRIMEARQIRRLPVVEQGQLVGVVTQTDITRGMISLSPLRYVGDIMTRDVATVDTATTVDEAARVMSTRNISCVIALHRQQVAGVITEKDLLKRIIVLHKDPTRTPVADIMSVPVVTVPPSYSILSASKKMETMHLHRLVVMEEREVCGIVTQTDIMRAIKRAFETMETQQHALMAQMANLVHYVTHDMEKARALLAGVQGCRPVPAGQVNAADGPAEMHDGNPCIL